MISKMEKAKGRRTDKLVDMPSISSKASKKKQLDEIGVTQKHASRLEQMASVPEEKFEELVDAESATADYHRAMPTANDPPSKQFSLKRIFVVTALAAVLAWAWRANSLLAWLFVHPATCFAIAWNEPLKRLGPVWSGTITGVLLAACIGFKWPDSVMIESNFDLALTIDKPIAIIGLCAAGAFASQLAASFKGCL